MMQNDQVHSAWSLGPAQSTHSPSITELPEFSLWPCQTPARRDGWPECGADVNIVIEIPDCGLSSVGPIEYIVRIAVTVEVACGYQRPATRNNRTPGGADQTWAGQVSDSCIARARME